MLIDVVMLRCTKTGNVAQLEWTDRQTDKRMDEQDHVLRQADALTEKKKIICLSMSGLCLVRVVSCSGCVCSVMSVSKLCLRLGYVCVRVMSCPGCVCLGYVLSWLCLSGLCPVRVVL